MDKVFEGTRKTRWMGSESDGERGRETRKELQGKRRKKWGMKEKSAERKRADGRSIGATGECVKK